VKRLVLELETGGNIRLEDGRPGDLWHDSCVDLVRSRFHSQDFLALGIKGVRVHRVTRIHNRHLRARFERRKAAIIGADPELAQELGAGLAEAGSGGGTGGASKAATAKAAADAARRRALEYLFYVPSWSTQQADREPWSAVEHIQHIAEHGFSVPTHAECAAPVPPPYSSPATRLPPPTFAHPRKRFGKSAQQQTPA